MAKVTRDPPAELQPAVDRLKQLAAEAGDHLLLGDGPVHPDAELLDLCAEAAQQRKAADAAREDWRRVPRGWAGDAKRAESDRLHERYKAAHRRLSNLLRRAGKLRAHTAAGIYAKAIAVRASREKYLEPVDIPCRRPDGKPAAPGCSVAGRNRREGLTMPQHDWQRLGRLRLCDACEARQAFEPAQQEWRPAVSPICPGDGRDSSRRRRPAPSGSGERTRELEAV